MITTERKARLVQERRYLAKKRGFSKAVRRYFKRIDRQAAASGLPHTFQRPAKPTTEPAQ